MQTVTMIERSKENEGGVEEKRSLEIAGGFEFYETLVANSLSRLDHEKLRETARLKKERNRNSRFQFV